MFSNFSTIAGEPSALLALQNSVRGLLASFAPFHTQALYEACLPHAKCVTSDQFMRCPSLKDWSFNDIYGDIPFSVSKLKKLEFMCNAEMFFIIRATFVRFDAEIVTNFT
ncbi:uncharacterized protein LOC131253338 [Magnolia sinica]|uniref:uncharacterized protein LOC131253338 n=1 Tax=Magnolia sinica TaxID=86752 RepID=UPI00265940F9|nr:uncharacterized protein LOC131253338 [Magnolia sinica]